MKNAGQGVTRANTSMTVAEGLQIQQDDLYRWKATLSRECFSSLLSECAKRNGALRTNHTGHDVFHSVPMEQWVNAWRPQ